MTVPSEPKDKHQESDQDSNIGPTGPSGDVVPDDFLEEAETYWSIVWGQFKKYRLSYFSLWGVIALVLLAIYAPVISLNLPFRLDIAGEVSYPWFSDLFNRNYYEGTVDIIFNTLMFILPASVGGVFLSNFLLRKKLNSQRRKVRNRIILGGFALTFLVNLFLLISPVEKPLSDARIRVNKLSSARDAISDATAQLSGLKGKTSFSAADVQAFNGLSENLDLAAGNLKATLPDSLRDLPRAFETLQGSAKTLSEDPEPSSEAIHSTVDTFTNIIALSSKGLSDIEASALEFGVEVDVAPSRAAIARAQELLDSTKAEGSDHNSALSQALAELVNARDLGNKENSKFLRVQLSNELVEITIEAKSSQEGAPLPLAKAARNLVNKDRAAAEATNKLIETSVKAWFSPRYKKKLSLAQKKHKAAVEDFLAASQDASKSLASRPAKTLAALQSVEQKVGDSAIFPLVRFSYRFPSEDFEFEMPWDENGSWDHPFGTNNQAKDVFAQMLFGTRIALTIGLVAVGIYLFIGVVLGALAGYFGGWIDMLVLRLVEIVICFPSLFMIMTLAALIEDRSIFHVMVIIGFTRWTGPARLVRGEFLRLKHQEFVEAAKALGLPEGRIIFRHVLPNALGPVLVAATFGIASAVLIESTISFLGVGDPNSTTWGMILNEGGVARSQRMILLPGFAIFVVVSLFNLMGEGLRDALDPKMRK